ncbi:MAG: class I SAM-dependent methyltransferase [Lachnospiraceae bacterium]|nr:class I SAM-dependent methyltransferase [Lachnospiraceae bacterium]
MKPNYKNWVPKGMVFGTTAGAIALVVIFAGISAFTVDASQTLRNVLMIISGILALVMICVALWSIFAYNMFSYDGKRQLSKAIIEGTAGYIKIPAGGTCLDVGCGSGALTIAAAKANPDAKITGIDRWGKEYASFSKKLCEDNAKAEGVSNVSFAQGDAVKLDFADETFDAVTSNYVYHNITGVNKQQLLLETLRVLKKGGTFAIHDIMSKSRYGDMDAFINKLKAQGYEDVRLIRTDNGMFMSKGEAMIIELTGSSLLVGTK